MRNIFVGECEKHFICRFCAKNYFEEQIEKGETNLLCPFLFCKNKFYIKNVVSKENIHLL